MKWAITHTLQDLTRSKHTLVEGKTLEEVTTLSIDDLIRVSQNPRDERNDRCLFGLQNQWSYLNLVRRQEKFCNASEDDRVLEYEIR